jgi:hypothetical protein
MREPDFAGLRDDAENAVRQPDFTVVRRRADRVRRRRFAASGAAGLAVAMVASGLGYAAVGGSGGTPPAATPTPSIRYDPDDSWPRVSSAVAGSPDEVYAIVQRCRDCQVELLASVDGGKSWKRRAEPPRPTSTVWSGLPVGLTAVGPGILHWRYSRVVSLVTDNPSGAAGFPTEEVSGPPTYVSVDGGRTWRAAELDPRPVAALTPGTRPIGCGLFDDAGPCQLNAVDPRTGRIAPLARQPGGITIERDRLGQIEDPAGGRVWVAGLDPVTRKPAVAVSSDLGRTWSTHVFDGGVPAVEEQGFVAAMYLPMVAAGPGGTAYALLYRGDREYHAYRTVDGGSTWERVPGRLGPVPYPGYVAGDGAHVIVLPTATGVRFLASHDGAAYRPVTVTGYPQSAAAPSLVVAQAAPGLYLEWNESVHLSRDGWTWQPADPL